MRQLNSIRLDLPPPISSNRYWRIFSGRVVISAEARAYRSHVKAKAIAIGMCNPIDGPVSVTVLLHPKKTKSGAASKTRIDLDNALKVVIDALQGVAYANDSQVVSIKADLGCPVTNGGLTIDVREAA